MNGVEETAHFCKDCAPVTGYEGLNREQLMALSIIGKKCEFCGRDASSGVRGSQSTIYWCFDCGLEYNRIVADLLSAENPDWLQRFAGAEFSLSRAFDPLYREWADAAFQKALRILKDRRMQDGRDKEDSLDK